MCVFIYIHIYNRYFGYCEISILLHHFVCIFTFLAVSPHTSHTIQSVSYYDQLLRDITINVGTSSYTVPAVFVQC